MPPTVPLQINGRDLVLGSLAEWQNKSLGDYKKIMKVLSMIGQVDRIRDEKKVKKIIVEELEEVVGKREEVEYLGKPGEGTLGERLGNLAGRKLAAATSHR